MNIQYTREFEGTDGIYITSIVDFKGETLKREVLKKDNGQIIVSWFHKLGGQYDWQWSAVTHQASLEVQFQIEYPGHDVATTNKKKGK